jgi:hypothetical protein
VGVDKSHEGPQVAYSRNDEYHSSTDLLGRRIYIDQTDIQAIRSGNPSVSVPGKCLRPMSWPLTLVADKLYMFGPVFDDALATSL